MRGATAQMSAMAAAAICCARMFLLSSTPTRECVTSCTRRSTFAPYASVLEALPISFDMIAFGLRTVLQQAPTTARCCEYA